MKEGKSSSSNCSLWIEAGGCLSKWRMAKGARQQKKESCVFCLFVFVHVCKTSVGMFILKLKYVQVFTYCMLTIKYNIL